VKKVECAGAARDHAAGRSKTTTVSGGDGSSLAQLSMLAEHK
jgi:hypothetical protein